MESLSGLLRLSCVSHFTLGSNTHLLAFYLTLSPSCLPPGAKAISDLRSSTQAPANSRCSYCNKKLHLSGVYYFPGICYLPSTSYVYKVMKFAQHPHECMFSYFPYFKESLVWKAIQPISGRARGGPMEPE